VGKYIHFVDRFCGPQSGTADYFGEKLMREFEHQASLDLHFGYLYPEMIVYGLYPETFAHHTCLSIRK